MTIYENESVSIEVKPTQETSVVEESGIFDVIIGVAFLFFLFGSSYMDSLLQYVLTYVQ